MTVVMYIKPSDCADIWQTLAQKFEMFDGDAISLITTVLLPELPWLLRRFMKYRHIHPFELAAARANSIFKGHSTSTVRNMTWVDII
ncbi:MAG: hypothetical protein ACLUKN_05455 [Bacilli bacterium]